MLHAIQASQKAMTVSQQAPYQDAETEAAEWKLGIVIFTLLLFLL